MNSTILRKHPRIAQIESSSLANTTYHLSSIIIRYIRSATLWMRRIARKCCHCLIFQHLPSSSALLHRSKAEIGALAVNSPKKKTVQVRNLCVFYVFQKIINKTQEIHFLRMDQSDSRSQISYSSISNPVKHSHYLMEIEKGPQLS